MNNIEPTRIRENTVTISISDKVMNDIKNGEEFAVYIGATKVVLKHYNETPRTVFCPGCGTKIGDRFYSANSFVCPICGVYVGRTSDGTLMVKGV